MGVIDEFYSDAERPSNASSLQTSEASLDRDSSSEEDFQELYKKFPDLRSPPELEVAKNKLSKQLQRVLIADDDERQRNGRATAKTEYFKSMESKCPSTEKYEQQEHFDDDPRVQDLGLEINLGSDNLNDESLSEIDLGFLKHTPSESSQSKDKESISNVLDSLYKMGEEHQSEKEAEPLDVQIVKYEELVPLE